MMIYDMEASGKRLKELRKQVSELMLLTCKDLTCRLRQTNIDLLKSQNLLKAQNEKGT